MNDIVTQERLIDWEAVLKTSGLSEEVPSKPINNIPQDIIDSWIMVEALSPESYKKPNDLAFADDAKLLSFHDRRLPWTDPKPPAKNKQAYYFVYLGSVRMSNAVRNLLRIYQDNRIERPSDKQGFAALGVILLNQDGVPIDEGLSVSSFGWAYGQALQQRLDNLKDWAIAEERLVEGIEKILFQKDDRGKPLTLDKIHQVYTWLSSNCFIPQEDLDAPTFAVRQDRAVKKGTPDVPLLNSFFLSDLQKVKKNLSEDNVGAALKQYLGITKPQQFFDLFEKPTSQDLIDSILQPQNMPLARWPGKGRHALVLLQQVAVNLAFKELKNEGLFSVNGPPGTGKTTLLRDIVAGNLVNRAQAMCGFDNPKDAFIHKDGIKFGKITVKLFELHESLRGYEMVVASCNNNAVENITHELPDLEAIAEDLTELRYFDKISDALVEKEQSTWGCIAAALGKSDNKHKVRSAAWTSNKTGLDNYLNYILGRSIRDEEGMPEIIDIDNTPSSPQEAMHYWEKARENFRQAYNASQKMITMVQKAYQAQEKLEKLNKQFIGAKAIEDEKSAFADDMMAQKTLADKAVDDQKQLLTLAKDSVDTSSQLQPGWFAKLFRLKHWKIWNAEHSSILQELKSVQQACSQAIKTQMSATTNQENAEKSLKEAQAQTTIIEKKLNTEKSKLKAVDVYCSNKLINPSFWQNSHRDQQLFTPNFLLEAHKLRDDVFVAAIHLHKAFIDASAQPIRQNLNIFFGVLKGDQLDHDKLPMLPHLWSTFFLLIPVASTTFASVERMFRELPPESMGWLLIDEAGQAPPQQAAGAILRAKRAMVVGDPLQVEPVESLPLSLLKGIAQHVGVNADEWLAPFSSAQELADNANRYGAMIPQGAGEMRIGAPLLVHRRCDDPMFSISNELAYANLMVHAKQRTESSVGKVLGDTQWFDLQGSAEEKWCPEEGLFTRDLVMQLFETLNETPDIFIITPFKIIAQRMKSVLRREARKFAQYGIQKVDKWLDDRVGTVHTFQGKEAEAVILVLGAQDDNQRGARHWAASSVNILNVAVSRAKQRLYIVGNKKLWYEIDNIKLINRHLKQ